MMAALKVMTYFFKISLSTHNWDRAKQKPPHLDAGAFLTMIAGRVTGC
ncbi:hypothetical protein [Aeromonas hydrophila]